MRCRNASKVSSPAGVAHAAMHSTPNTIAQGAVHLVIDMAQKNYTIRAMLANLALETPRNLDERVHFRLRAPVCLLTDHCRLACTLSRTLQRCNNAHRNPSQE